MRWLLLCALLCAPSFAASLAEPLSHGRFQNLAIYRPAGKVKQVVLFLSGQQGWNADMAGMAQALAGEGALVAGIDVPAFFADLEQDDADCVFPDGDLENLGRFLQAYYRLPTYRPPVLVGYSSGAALAYAMLAQAPPDTFAGGISLAFCLELPLKKPLCRSENLEFIERRRTGMDLVPAGNLDAPWIALHGQVDRVCDVATTRRFVANVRGSELVVVPGAGHGSSVAGPWVPQLKSALQRLTARQPSASLPAPDELKGLPIVEVAARGDSDTLAVILSGDGGWAGIDKELAAELAVHGIPVVGLDSLRYFWRPRTPQSTAADIDRILRYYLSAWSKQHAVLIGYSQGADVLPFVINGLSPQARASLQLAALLGPGRTAVFEFHLSNWLSGGDAGLPLRPELEKPSQLRTLCVFGQDETDTLCSGLSAANIRIMKLPGGHHFDGDYRHLAALILAQLSAP